MLARHTHIATSLADHAERVARKRARGQQEETQSAAARMAALRMRISARSASGSCATQGSIGDGLAASAAPTSTEDGKIHFVCADNGDIQHASMGEAVASDDVGSIAAAAVGGGPNSAADNAAAAWAWHARVQGGAGGVGHHLSAG